VVPKDTENTMIDEQETEKAPQRDDAVAEFILGALASGKPLTFQAVAQAYAETRRKPKDPPNIWRRYLTAVRQQAIHLARQGRIELLHRREPVDPNDFKGLIHMRLAD